MFDAAVTVFQTCLKCPFRSCRLLKYVSKDDTLHLTTHLKLMLGDEHQHEVRN